MAFPGSPSFGARGLGTRTPLIALLLAALTIAAYVPLRENGFISVDDPTYITRNHRVLDGLRLSGVRWAFATFHAGNWHPLTWLSHMADVSLVGTRPAAHHLVSLGIHALTAALLFVFLRGMTGAPWRSAAVAAFFAVHPLHVESVAWASERKDVLSGLFFALSLGAYAEHARRRRGSAYLALCLTVGLGLLAKPMGVTLPFLLLLLDFWPLGRLRHPRAAAGLLVEKIPLFALAAASAMMTFAAQTRGGWVKDTSRYPVPERLANALYSCVSYLRKTFWPSDLAVPYGYPEGLSPGVVAACLLLLAVVTTLVLTAARRAPFAAVGWFWYLGMLVPVIGIVQVADQGMADRYTYLPLIGIFLALAWSLALLAGAAARRRAVAAALLAAAIAVCAALTWRQAGHWRSDGALFGHAVRVTKANWLAYDNYGATLIEEGKYREAAAVYGLLPQTEQAHPSVLNNMGVLAMNMGNYREAEARFRQALRLRPNYGRVYFNLGELYVRQGQVTEATRQYDLAAALGYAGARRAAERLRLR